MANAGDENAVMRVLDQFLETLNARDPGRFAAGCRFPHVRFARGAMKIWRSAEEFTRGRDLARIPMEDKWHSGARYFSSAPVTSSAA
jgi:hypothetical protein